MKKALFFLLFLAWAGMAQAQVVGEIKDVLIDEARGSIIVQTQYKVNGEVVDVDGAVCLEKDGKFYNGVKECIGRSRYTEESGKDNAEIIQKALDDVKIHVTNLILRIPQNTVYVQTKVLETQKALTQPIIDAIKSDLVGQKITATEAVTEYKGKEITVTYDSKNSISDISAVTP